MGAVDARSIAAGGWDVTGIPKEARLASQPLPRRAHRFTSELNPFLRAPTSATISRNRCCASASEAGARSAESEEIHETRKTARHADCSGIRPISGRPICGHLEAERREIQIQKRRAQKEGTIIIAESASDLDVNTTGTSADGAPTSAHYTVPAKGGEGKIISGRWEAVSAKRPSPNERVIIFSSGGKVVYTVRSRISGDGKTMTTTVSGTNAAGKEVAGTNVYEKQ
jgi:hypothetical protein